MTTMFGATVELRAVALIIFLDSILFYVKITN